ncbi:MAG: hypothetical protein ACI4F9_01065 [Lachnospiraceae bacterium]
MTVREFLKSISGNKVICLFEQDKEILKISTYFIDAVKEELLDREIKEKGISIPSNCHIDIDLKQINEED